jgi:NhaP-type Na+/H+ or K+/H+ antiporter
MTSPPQDPSAFETTPKTGVGGAATDPTTSAVGSIGLMQGLRQLIDRLLVADVFVVLAGALWFMVAVVLHSQGVEAPLQSFQRLWEPLFTPAIGLLMAGALLSGALGWWQRRGQR